MSGASGKVPAAIHLTPEALDGGIISKIETGDILKLMQIKEHLILKISKSSNYVNQKKFKGKTQAL